MLTLYLLSKMQASFLFIVLFQCLLNKQLLVKFWYLNICLLLQQKPYFVRVLLKESKCKYLKREKLAFIKNETIGK